MSKQLNSKVKTATKWSILTEFTAKLVAPISTMVLARILTPEAFGVLVTVTMVISFAELFTDAGFQKYLIQKKFETTEELFKSTTVAFWSNLCMSIIIWGIIILFSSQIATMVGNEGYGNVISISCICIPLAAFSSIQMALYKRSLDFKTLFIRRIIVLFIPLFITIPLAYWFRSYWALVVGMIVREIVNAILLTSMSKWKPSFYYDWIRFKRMFSFTAWSMLEAISIWLTNYLDIFIVGTVLGTYYLGVYRTGIHTTNQIFAIFTAATTPILFSTLSKLQDDEKEFNNMFFKFQKSISLFILPIGILMFLFNDVITSILLGNQWEESAYLIGWWGLTSSATIITSYYCSEVFRAKGRPKYSLLSQSIHLAILVITILACAKYGFKTFCLSRSLIRFSGIIVNLFFLYKLTRIKFLDLIINIRHAIVAATLMSIIYLILPENPSIIYRIICAIACTATYTLAILLFKEERTIVLKFLKHYLKAIK